MRRRRLLRLLCLLGACWAAGFGAAFGQPAAGPTYTLVVRGVPLREALEALGRLTRIDLVYTSDLVAGKQSYCAGHDMPAEELLACVLAGAGLDYVRSSSGAYVLIEAIQAPPRYGDLAGSVVDRETGAPLPFASVLLADAAAGTTTNEAGLFSFSTLLSGPHRVVVTYVGYETTVDSVWIGPGARARLAVSLQPKEVALAPIVVDGLEQRLPSDGLGAGELSQSDWTAAFSASGDVARAATTLLGVSSEQPLADLHIQGSASGEHLTLLDGVPVRDPVSLGRHLSAFSPLAVERMTVYKAGFGVEMGSHLSGAVAVEHDVGGGEGRHVAFRADPLSFNGRLQTRLRLPGGQHGAAMVALRQSAWDIYRDPGLSSLLRRWGAVDPAIASIWLAENVNPASLVWSTYRPAIAFTDVHVAARLHLSPFRVLHASAYHARSHIGAELTGLNTDRPGDADRLFLTRDEYDWENWAGQVRHSWLLGARSIATVHLRGSLHTSGYTYRGLQAAVPYQLSADRLEHVADSLRPALGAQTGSYEHHRIGEASVQAVLEHSFSPRHHVDAGVTAAHTAARLRVRNGFLLPFAHRSEVWEWSGYVRGRIGLGWQTVLEPGVRLTYVPQRQTLYAEPRLAVRYDRAASRIGPYAVRVAAGLYRQFTNQYELTSSGSSAVIPSILFWLPVDASVAPPRVYHLASEVLLTPARGWSVSLEGYYKAQPRLLTFDYAALAGSYDPPEWGLESQAQDVFVGATSGRAFGGGVRLHREDAWLATTVSYSFGQSLRRFPSRFEGRLQPVPWDEPHRLQLSAEASLGRGFTAGLGWQGGWGRRWAFRRAYYDYLALRHSPVSFGPHDLTDPSAQRLPPYYRFDAGLTYRHAWTHGSVHVRAFVVNVLDRRNVYDWSLERTGNTYGTLERTLPGRQPVLSVRVEY